MKRPCNYIEIEAACNSPFVTTNEIMIILGGVSKTKADSFRMSLEEELEEEKVASENEIDLKKRKQLEAACYYFKDTRPHRLPIKRVLEKAHIDIDHVRREANKMRKAKKIEGSEYIEKEIQIETRS